MSRAYDAATLAYLQSRGPIVAKVLFHVTTGGGEHLCLSNDIEDRAFSVDGATLDFTGAGTLLSSDPISMQSGLAVRMHNVYFSSVSTEVEDMVKGYDTRFARATLHRVLLDPSTREAVAAPHRVFKGFINAITFNRAAPGEAGLCTVELASEARVLTRTLTAKQSDAAQKLRAGDRVRRYVDISGSIPVFWGQKRSR